MTKAAFKQKIPESAKFKWAGKGSWTALSFITEVAKTHRRAPLALHRAAPRLDVSVSYLEQLAAPMRRHGLIKSVLGAAGGYLLARPAEDISVLDVLAAVPPDLVKHLTGNNADTQHLLQHVDKSFCLLLRRISVADVIIAGFDRHPVFSNLFES